MSKMNPPQKPRKK